MEEHEYKSSYNELTSVRCVFEKALTNHRAKCTLSKHFCLADREGYSCCDAASSSKCRQLLELLRQNSVFVLKVREAEGVLPHNMEIRVQVGGLSGLVRLFDEKAPSQTANEQVTLPPVDDIQMIVKQAVKRYGSLQALPYSQIIQSVVQFQGRRKRQH